MIIIPDYINSRLKELDMNLQSLGQNLYSRKIYKDYEEKTTFNNFHLEVHRDGSFTLHFTKGILGYLETKSFSNNKEEIIDEMSLLNASVISKLEKC